MKYVVEILRDGRIWSQDLVEAPNRTMALASLLMRSADGSEEVEDYNAWDEDEFPVDPDDVRETHILSLRVHRVSPTPKESKEELEIMRMMNEDPRSPFRGMIDMPKED